jgi:hypothetical protein
MCESPKKGRPETPNPSSPEGKILTDKPQRQKYQAIRALRAVCAKYSVCTPDSVAPDLFKYCVHNVQKRDVERFSFKYDVQEWRWRTPGFAHGNCSLVSQELRKRSAGSEATENGKLEVGGRGGNGWRQRRPPDGGPDIFCGGGGGRGAYRNLPRAATRVNGATNGALRRSTPKRGGSR